MKKATRAQPKKIPAQIHRKIATQMTCLSPDSPLTLQKVNKAVLKHPSYSKKILCFTATKIKLHGRKLHFCVSLENQSKSSRSWTNDTRATACKSPIKSIFIRRSSCSRSIQPLINQLGIGVGWILFWVGEIYCTSHRRAVNKVQICYIRQRKTLADAPAARFQRKGNSSRIRVTCTRRVFSVFVYGCQSVKRVTIALQAAVSKHLAPRACKYHMYTLYLFYSYQRFSDVCSFIQC